MSIFILFGSKFTELFKKKRFGPLIVSCVKFCLQMIEINIQKFYNVIFPRISKFKYIIHITYHIDNIYCFLIDTFCGRIFREQHSLVNTKRYKFLLLNWLYNLLSPLIHYMIFSNTYVYDFPLRIEYVIQFLYNILKLSYL